MLPGNIGGSILWDSREEDKDVDENDGDQGPLRSDDVFDLQRRDDAEAALGGDVGGDEAGDAGEAEGRPASGQVLNLPGDERHVRVLEQRIHAEAEPEEGDQAADVGNGQREEADVHGGTETLLEEDGHVHHVGDYPENGDSSAQEHIGHYLYDHSLVITEIFNDWDIGLVIKSTSFRPLYVTHVRSALIALL